MTNEEYIMYGALFILALALFTVVISTNRNCDKCHYCEALVETAEKLVMYNKSIEKDLKIQGVYFGNSHYCVWTKDMSTCDIMNDDPSLMVIDCQNETALHELFHHVLLTNDRSYNHFCQPAAEARG